MSYIGSEKIYISKEKSNNDFWHRYVNVSIKQNFIMLISIIVPLTTSPTEILEELFHRFGSRVAAQKLHLFLFFEEQIFLTSCTVFRSQRNIIIICYNSLCLSPKKS